MCHLTLPYLSYYGFNAKIFIIQNAIIVIEDYSLSIDKKNTIEYSDTYLILKKNHDSMIDINLFRNYALIEEITILNNQVKIQVKNKKQSFIKSIGFNTTPISLNIKFKLSLNQSEIEVLLKKWNLL